MRTLRTQRRSHRLIRMGWILLGILFLSACSGAFERGGNEAVGNDDGLPMIPTPTLTLLPRESPPLEWWREFQTDFNLHTVPFAEILSTGQSMYDLASIDDPRFMGIEQADAWLKPNEAVIIVRSGGEARAYPIQILLWHEVVNDVFAEIPMAVTYCPLTNTAVAFERTLQGHELEFGVTGRVRYGNQILFDHQTESWWQQASGQAIAGKFAGEQLAFYPAAIASWKTFKDVYPDGRVLSKDTGFTYPYGSNPYTGYDNQDQAPWLYNGPPTPEILNPMARVLGVAAGSEARAYPFVALEKSRVVNDHLGEKGIAVFWKPDTASPLDAKAVAGGHEVGSAIAFDSQVEGRVLTFAYENNRIIDLQTKSVWDELGIAVDGPLKGYQLRTILAFNHFWFSWFAFEPETGIYQP